MSYTRVACSHKKFYGLDLGDGDMDGVVPNITYSGFSKLSTTKEIVKKASELYSNYPSVINQ